MRLERIGLLGGTFDPVHYGHLQLATYAKEEFGLEKVVFIPCAQPPHKNDATLTSFRHRLAMLNLAAQYGEGFECNEIEDSLSKPSYTIDTIKELRQHFNKDCQFYFILGADAFLDILTWKSYKLLLQMVHIIISYRLGFDSTKLTKLLMNQGYIYQGRAWRNGDSKKNIYILKKNPVDLSSSMIRGRVEQGDSFQQFMPQPVYDYIQKNKIYQYDNVKEISRMRHGCEG